MKKIIGIVIAAILVVTAVLLVKDKKEALAKETVAVQYPLVVNTEVLKKTSKQLTHPYLALVKSNQDVTLSTNVGGRVDYIIPVGSQVKVGQKLVTIDSSSLKAKIEASRLKIQSSSSKKVALIAKLNNLKQTHNRTLKLLAVEGASVEQSEAEIDGMETLRADIDGVSAQIRSAQAELEALHQELTYANIVSPVDGVVSNIDINKGGIAAPGKPLISLSTLGGKYLLVRTAENQQVGQAEYQGQSCQLTPLNKTQRGLQEFTCHVSVKAPAGSLVDINLISQQGLGLYVPLNAVLQINGQTAMLIVKDNKAVKRPVKILASGVEGFAIKGLSVGERYVVAKPDILLKLTTGQAIKLAK